MEFSRKGYWSRLPLPSPEDLPNPGIEPGSLTLWADFLLTEVPGKSTGVGCHFPSPGHLLDPGINSRSPEPQEDSLLSEAPRKHLLFLGFYSFWCSCKEVSTFISPLGPFLLHWFIQWLWAISLPVMDYMSLKIWNKSFFLETCSQAYNHICYSFC